MENKLSTKIWIKPKSSALPITREELKALGIVLNDKDEYRGELKSYGVWNIPVTYKALAMNTVYNRDVFPIDIKSTTAYGIRTMYNVRSGGYELEGYVSIQGKKYSAFTSSQLFELPCGMLINVATIHARKD